MKADKPALKQLPQVHRMLDSPTFHRAILQVPGRHSEPKLAGFAELFNLRGYHLKISCLLLCAVERMFLTRVTVPTIRLKRNSVRSASHYK